MAIDAPARVGLGLELKPRDAPPAAFLDSVQRRMLRRQPLPDPARAHAERPRGVLDGEAAADQEIQLDPRALQRVRHAHRSLGEPGFVQHGRLCGRQLRACRCRQCASHLVDRCLHPGELPAQLPSVERTSTDLRASEQRTLMGDHQDKHLVGCIDHTHRRNLYGSATAQHLVGGASELDQASPAARAELQGC